LEEVVVHLESVLSRIPREWQGSHTSGGAARAEAVLPPSFTACRRGEADGPHGARM